MYGGAKMICFNCSSNINSSGISYRYAGKSIGFAEFFPNLEIRFCTLCQIAQVDHAYLQKDKLDTYYSHIYRDKLSLGVDSSEYHKRYFSARGKGQAKLIKKYVKNKKVNTIFEFGAGHGYSLIEVAKLFPSAGLYTNEIDKTVSELYRFKRHQSNLKYSIVIMSHVLEHLLYPQHYILDAINNLESEGVLFIEVPNETTQVLHSTSPLEPHITFFNLDSLKNFIERNFKDQLEVMHAGTAGIAYAGENRLKKNFLGFIKWISYSLYFRITKPLKWAINRGKHLPEFNFCNDTTQDVWSNIRIVCKKR
jgi:hypothetical protein